MKKRLVVAVSSFMATAVVILILTDGEPWAQRIFGVAL